MRPRLGPRLGRRGGAVASGNLATIEGSVAVAGSVSGTSPASGVVSGSVAVAGSVVASSGFTGSGLVRAAGADVLATAANYALPDPYPDPVDPSPWSFVAIVEITGTDGASPFDIFTWGYGLGAGGFRIAFTTGTSPDRVRVQYTRAPSSAVSAERVLKALYADITTIGRFKLMITHDGTTLRGYFAKLTDPLATTAITDANVINLGGAAPVIELAGTVGKLSWAMGDGVAISEANFLAADETGAWSWPSEFIVAQGGTVIASRSFSSATITTTADVEYTGSLMSSEAGAITTGSARLTAEA